ncbi:MAG: outer membrane lipoprotein-sorting protein [Candidatus Omnitrophota bacterium]
MRCLIFCSIIVLFINNAICFSQTTGLWVAQQINAVEDGDTSRIEMEMVLTDKQNRIRNRSLFLERKDYPEGDKFFLKFTYPNDIQGTSFLVWEHDDQENERFLCLPAMGRIRRIATDQKQENFVGTDFSYEDISGRKLADYTYELVDENKQLNGIDCYVLASYAKDKSANYNKIVSFVCKDNFIIIKSDYYDRKGDLEKTYTILELKQIDNIWTPLVFKMENHDMNHKTDIEIKKVDYNLEIDDFHFERDYLKR